CRTMTGTFRAKRIPVRPFRAVAGSATTTAPAPSASTTTSSTTTTTAPTTSTTSTTIAGGNCTIEAIAQGVRARGLPRFTCSAQRDVGEAFTVPAGRQVTLDGTGVAVELFGGKDRFFDVEGGSLTLIRVRLVGGRVTGDVGAPGTRGSQGTDGEDGQQGP